MLENLSLWKTLRVCAWIARFLANCKGTKSVRTNGPLTTDEIKSQEIWCTECAQAEATRNSQQINFNLTCSQGTAVYWSAEKDSLVRTQSTFQTTTYDPSWGSHPYNDQGQRNTLGPSPKSIDEKVHQKLLGLQAISSPGLPVPTTRKFASRPHRRSDALRNYWSRLRWSH